MAGGLVLLALAVILLQDLRRRRDLMPKTNPANPQTDLTHMRLLIQTMRDLLDQQKSLAHQLNAALDKKVVYIRDSVDAAMKDLEMVRGVLKETVELVEQVRQRPELGAAPANVAPLKLRVLEKAAERADSEIGDDAAGSVQVIALPKSPPADEEVLNTWVGLDFPGEEPDTFSFVDVPDQAPEAPDDAEAARDAFRALLLDFESTHPEREKRKLASVSVSPGPKSSSSNGGSHGPANGGSAKSTTPVQSRVYEYSDAGMSIAQIAKELGIGKGEVRLILSLRKARDR